MPSALPVDAPGGGIEILAQSAPCGIDLSATGGLLGASPMNPLR
jgi:hypothetical protein